MGMSAEEHEWDEQTATLKGNGYTTEDIVHRSFHDRSRMIGDNCDDGDYGFGVSLFGENVPGR